MKLHTILIVLSSLISFNSFSQADCVIIYEVTGQIDAGSTKYVSVEIPTSRYLTERVEKNTSLAFNEYKIKKNEFRVRTSTYMASEFCKEDAAEIVPNMFKNQKDFIPIYLTNKNDERIEMKIPVEQISISIGTLSGKEDFEAYIVNLGTISTD